MSTTIRELMLAGAHFGHRARFWNPKMAEFIYGKYHSTHIINLDYTLVGIQSAAKFLQSIAAANGKVLYLCTKSAAEETIQDDAESVGMYYINRRWLGGTLTNFKTTRNSVERLSKIEEDIGNGILKSLTKKEGIKLMSMKEKLEKAIGGIREMKELPDALFIIDAGWHRSAVREANKLGLPVVAVVDTNHLPEGVDYIIPGNDDSRQAIKIYSREVTAAIAAGKKEWEQNLVEDVKAASAKSVNPVTSEAKRTTKVIVAGRGRTSSDNKEVTVEEAKPRTKKIVQVKKAPARKPADTPVKAIQRDKENAAEPSSEEQSAE